MRLQVPLPETTRWQPLQHWFWRWFKEDAGEHGSLPSYAIIEPAYYLGAKNDQHPPKSIGPGEELIAAVYNALRSGPASQWLSTMLIIT